LVFPSSLRSFFVGCSKVEEALFLD
jgi:hypothetical protein